MGRPGLDVEERRAPSCQCSNIITAIMDNFGMEGEVTETPMSRTHQYRKVMKPMLERKLRRQEMLTRLMSHLGHKLALAPVRGPLVPQFHLKPSPPLQEADLGYNSGRDSTPSPSPPATTFCQETVWRPF